MQSKFIVLIKRNLLPVLEKDNQLFADLRRRNILELVSLAVYTFATLSPTKNEKTVKVRLD